MQVVGYRDSSFKAADGTQINGITIYVTDSDTRVEGVKTDKFFMSDRVSNRSNYLPKVGDEIEVYYNRYGKLYSIECK